MELFFLTIIFLWDGKDNTMPPHNRAKSTSIFNSEKATIVKFIKHHAMHYDAQISESLKTSVAGDQTRLSILTLS